MGQELLRNSELPNGCVHAGGAQLLRQPRSVTADDAVVLDRDHKIMIAGERDERRIDRQRPDRVNDRHADPLVR